MITLTQNVIVTEIYSPSDIFLVWQLALFSQWFHCIIIDNIIDNFKFLNINIQVLTMRSITCQTIILTNTQWKHTHTLSGSKSTPNCSLPNQQKKKNQNWSPNRRHARWRTNGCLLSLKYRPPEISWRTESSEGGSAQKSVSFSRTAIGWLAKSFYVTLMEALWSMASAHRTLQKGTASHYPNTLRHTSPQVLPKIRRLGLASGTRVTAIWHNRQSANLMLLSNAFLSGRRITIAC